MDEPKLSKVLEFGQQDDDIVLDLFNGLNKMVNGYYQLINYGDDWWKAMNQDSWFDSEMKEVWESVDWDEVETALELLSKLMIGTYVRLNRFTEGLNEISELGLGHRPQRKEKNNEQV